MEKHISDLINGERNVRPDLIRNDMDGKVTTINYFNKLKGDLKKFDDRAWSLKEGYKTPNFLDFSERLEGFSSGLYIFAGPSNAGKTALMLNVAEDLCMHKENKLMAVFFTLDDSTNVVLPRIVAMRENMPIGVVAKPGRFQSLIDGGHELTPLYEEYLQKRERGIENLGSDSDRLTVYDSTEIHDMDELIEQTKQIQNFVKTMDPEMNIVVVIDSLKDIHLPGNNLSENDKSNEIAKGIKQLSVDLDIIIFASMHLRKMNANRRPVIDDLRDSNRLEFEASCIFLIYNDISRNKESAKIYANDANDPERKIPVLEIDWAKNKISSYKGRSFCHFITDNSKAIQCTGDECRRFTALLHEL